MSEKLLVPDIGDFENVEVIELLVKQGQEIKENDPVVTIESDKSSVEIPSIFSGKIESISVKVGDKVSKGDLLLSISNTKKKDENSNDVPKNTENIIQEAEKYLKKNPEQKIFEQKKTRLKQEMNKDEIPSNFCTSAISIAGDNKDQKLAATITPPVKPRHISKIFLLVDLKKNTNEAPIAVRINVTNQPTKAISTTPNFSPPIFLIERKNSIK